jgi:caffeoyl-CoA O-methyltransferase
MPVTYSDALSEYVVRTYAGEDEILRRILRGIEAAGLPTITVAPEEGRFLQFLAAAVNARRTVEIGTLGGYSGTWIARGMPAGGRLITLEVNEQHARVAREHFRLAGLERQVEVRVGDAHALLPGLAAEGPFDLVFIDADKQGYVRYLEWAVDNLRPGGVVAAHNAFAFGGNVIDERPRDEGVLAMQAFNQRMAQESRLLSTIFPAGDGMAVGVRIG